MFEYDAQTGTLVRVSVGQDGYNDNGNSDTSPETDARIARQEYLAGSRGGAIARTMSDDGSLVFFQSPVGLTPRALDRVQVGVGFSGEPNYAQNVYEYRDGNVYLISDGQDVTAGSGGEAGSEASETFLLGTSASGSDVFFTTGDSLVPQDADTQVDFYDARAGGGFPAPTMSDACQGDACQGPVGSQQAFGSPASTTFSGAGNLAPLASRPAVRSKSPSRAQKLARALKVCRKKPRRKRHVCESQVRKQFGHTPGVKTSKGRGK